MVVVMHPDDEHNLLLLRKDLCGWRLVRRLTQEQMADSISAPRHTMGDLERGTPGAMTFCNLHKWARCLDFTLMWRFADLPACSTTPEMLMLDAMASSGKG